jgi:hypothetical protein
MRRPLNPFVVTIGLAVVAVLDRASDALERHMARRIVAEPDLPYPGFDEAPVIPALADTEWLLSWVPDALPDDLVDWLLGADGSAS